MFMSQNTIINKLIVQIPQQQVVQCISQDLQILFNLMSILDKLGDSKTKLLLGLGGVALMGAIGYLYKSYSTEEEQSTHEQLEEIQEYNVDLQIQKLKQRINLDNPSLEDVKDILKFSLEASKKEIFKFSKNFKKDRRKYNKEKRNQNLDEYLRMVAQGMTQIQEIGMSLQQQIMMKIGITEQHFAKYQHQLGAFLQEQMMAQGVGSASGKQLSLQEVKRAINLQIQYMQMHGDDMVQKLANTCSGWGQQEKTLVPTLISVYIADQVFEDHPEIDEDDLQGAQMKYQNQLQQEMYRLQTVMAPMMTKLTQGLGFGGMGGGMGGMGGMDMGMGGMDMGMGGMDMGMGGNGQISMEQLQQLRMQDPAAFQQLMYMMSQGMR